MFREDGAVNVISCVQQAAQREGIMMLQDSAVSAELT